MSIALISDHDQSHLINLAQNAAAKAFAPYSKFYVGAAVLTHQGNIFIGCNVENASYGLTICAERAAICAAVAAEGGDIMKIRAIAVVNQHNTFCSPCGACRQFIWQFGKDAMVIFPSNNGLKKLSVNQLLPEGFDF